MSENLGFDNSHFSDQVVIVTGAASGIGAAAAKLIARRGGRVILLDRDEAGLAATAEGIDREAGISESMVLDVTDESGIKSAVGEVLAKYSRIDALANSAGITGPTGVNVEDLTTEDFERILKINLYGSIWLTQAVLPSMKANKYGRIVHLASIAGKEGNPGMAPYNTSKAGLIGFIKGVAKETASLGISINAIAPAVIRSNLNVATNPDTMAYMLSRIPVGRQGEGEEVAELVAFAASRACSFTTGFTFDISGGRATY